MSEQSIQNTDKIATGGKQPRGDSASTNAVALGDGRRRSGSNLPDRTRDAGPATGLPAEVWGTPVSPETDRGAEPPRPLEQMHRLIERAGEVPLTDRQIAVLTEPFTDDMVLIKPNGAIYIPHNYYRDRLDRVFGVGGWAIIPLAAPKNERNRVVWWGFLKAGGRYIDSAMGGCTYVSTNPEMNWDDAVEGAKSDCITRCCKSLTMFRELWDKSYQDYYKSTYCEQMVNPKDRDRKIWKKKGDAMPGVYNKPMRGSAGEYFRASRLVDENQRALDAIATDAPLRLAARDEYSDHTEYYDDGREDV